MSLRQKLFLGVAVLCLCTAWILPAAAATDPANHAVSYMETHPAVVTAPAELWQYQRERMALLGLNPPAPSAPVSSPGAIREPIVQVYAVHARQAMDVHAFPLESTTVQCAPGCGGASGTWAPTRDLPVASAWQISPEYRIGRDALSALAEQIKLNVGVGYAATAEPGKATPASFQVADGVQQSLYVFETGRYWIFDCDCLVRTAVGDLVRSHISGIAYGREYLPNRSPVVEAGEPKPYRGLETHD